MSTPVGAADAAYAALERAARYFEAVARLHEREHRQSRGVPDRSDVIGEHYTLAKQCTSAAMGLREAKA